MQIKTCNEDVEQIPQTVTKMLNKHHESNKENRITATFMLSENHRKQS